MSGQEVIEKVEPDTGFLESPGSFISRASQKVQLDVDDAPFLLPDEVETQSSEVATKDSSADLAKKEAEPDEPKQPSKNKKKIIIIVIGLVVLLLLGGVGFFLYQKFTAPVIEPEVIIVPKKTEELAIKDTIVYLEPFWLELTDKKGNKRFLVSKFSLIANQANLDKEIADKLIIVRDAIYYYLSNKDYEFLTDSLNGETIKKEITTLVNTYLLHGKVESVLFENYLVQ